MMAVLTVVGHVALDRVVTDHEDRTQIGGPPSYVSLISRTLGLDIRTATKVGDDLPDWLAEHIRQLGINLQDKIVEGAQTTKFILDYRRPSRRLFIESVCEEISVEDVGGHHDAVLISPIVGEVPRQAAYKLSEAEVVALDPQGYVREIKDNGSVVPRPWLDIGLLKKVSIYKSSARELELVTGSADTWQGLEEVRKLGAEVALATTGSQGAYLMASNVRYHVPAYKVDSVVDPTGAGDVFVGGFLSEYLKGKEAPWCASVGAAAASLVVETEGATIDSPARTVMERAEEIYDRVVVT
jgi:sugar/nucleoside kinase (ribokinase family)